MLAEKFSKLKAPRVLKLLTKEHKIISTFALRYVTLHMGFAFTSDCYYLNV